MRVAVIGGGVFGATAAVEFARTGARVDLYEARSDILSGATANCQARLHRGYHYPRSDSTAAAARDAFPVFVERFPEAIRYAQHHYVIANESRVSAVDYLAFCDRLGLAYEVVDSRFVHNAQLTVKVSEAFVNVDTLRRLLRRELAVSGATIHVERRVSPEQLDHDLIVVATYGRPWSQPLKYEHCEIALIRLGHYTNESFVVLDGPFTSLDPTPTAGLYMLYDVDHSVRDVLGTFSVYERMLTSASRHLFGMDLHGRGVCHYVRSMWATRAVLPDVDDSDERPTLVERDGNVVSILGGKICTAVTTARSLVELVPA